MASRYSRTFATVVLAAVALAGYALRAQEDRPPKPAPDRPSISIQDALRQRFDFAFDKPTTLEAAAKVLSEGLGLPVVIDRAGLDRSGLKLDDEVQLRLKGMRLKTGLKLLLDQLDLTYRVEADDNLLVITDAVGASDPLLEVLTELKSLHRDIHDLQDAVDVVQDALGITEEEGPKMRKPTIIEEVPSGKGPKPEPKEPETIPPPARSRPGL
jgi:hypothetical protein